MPLRRASTMQDAYVAFEASRCMSVPGDQGKDSVAFVYILHSLNFIAVFLNRMEACSIRPVYECEASRDVVLVDEDV
jgi:hypothetical protein